MGYREKGALDAKLKIVIVRRSNDRLEHDFLFVCSSTRQTLRTSPIHDFACNVRTGAALSTYSRDSHRRAFIKRNLGARHFLRHILIHIYVKSNCVPLYRKRGWSVVCNILITGLIKIISVTRS